MPLMERLHHRHWLQLSYDEKYSMIQSLQLQRIDAIEQSRQVKPSTKSAAKNRAKREPAGTEQKRIDKLAQLMSSMTPEQLAAIKAEFNL